MRPIGILYPSNRAQRSGDAISAPFFRCTAQLRRVAHLIDRAIAQSASSFGPKHALKLGPCDQAGTDELFGTLWKNTMTRSRHALQQTETRSSEANGADRRGGKRCFVNLSGVSSSAAPVIELELFSNSGADIVVLFAADSDSQVYSGSNFSTVDHIFNSVVTWILSRYRTNQQS